MGRKYTKTSEKTTLTVYFRLFWLKNTIFSMTNLARGVGHSEKNPSLVGGHLEKRTHCGERGLGCHPPNYLNVINFRGNYWQNLRKFVPTKYPKLANSRKLIPAKCPKSSIRENFINTKYQNPKSQFFKC